MRPTRQEIDDEIVERAAALFARYGFQETSLQRIADAVGYSKTGLLHRFPTKEALQDAVIERWAGKVRDIAGRVRDLPPGPERDRAVITELVELVTAGAAGAVPGLAAWATPTPIPPSTTAAPAATTSVLMFRISQSSCAFSR